MRNRRAIAFFLACSAVFAMVLALSWMCRRPSAYMARATLSEFDADAVAFLEIDRALADGTPERMRFSRVGGAWRMDAPIKAAADGEAVKKAIDALVFAELRDALSGSDMGMLGKSLRDFGLSAPRVSIALSSQGRREMYSFGRLTAQGNEVYVQQDGMDDVFTVPAQILQQIERPLAEFRRHSLLSFTKDEVSGVGLKDAGEPFSKLVRQDGSWRLMEPVDAPADRMVAERLVNAICSERIIAYAGPGEKTGLGNDEGCFVLSLRNSDGNVEKVVLGASAGTNEIWALTSEKAVVRVRASLLELCRESQKTIEDTRVFPVEPQAVTSMSVLRGYPAYTLSRKSATEPWRLTSPVDAPADADHAEKLLSSILSLRGADIMLSSTNTFNVSVSTGTTNFPACAVLGKSFIGDGRLADLRDRTLLRYPAVRVKKVRVRTAAGVAWDATKYEALIKCIAEGLVAESVDVIAPGKDDFKRCGFDRPSFTFTFELDDPASSLRALLLGAAAPGGGRYATIGGLDDASFVLSAATVSILTKPVEETLEKK